MIPTYQRTKIVATIGPASSSEEVLEKLMLGGVDVCRLNLSHGEMAEHVQVIDRVMTLNRKHDLHVGVLADLQGPKIRIGEVAGDAIELKDSARIVLTTRPVIGTEERLTVTYERFARDIRIGDAVLLDDGRLRLEVIESDGEQNAIARVVRGGPLSSRKGVNLPDTEISLPALTDRDKRQLHAILELGDLVSWVALSFVRRAEDIAELKREIESHRGAYAPRVVAKIEKPEALREIDAIVRAADAVMVARGDLGVELPLEQVPLIQKSIVDKCRLSSTPVIIATQMMETMIKSFTPTRAEVSDVANAVMEGADALMLSGETSIGRDPSRVVEMMQRIVERTEGLDDIYYRYYRPSSGKDDRRFISDSICFAASDLANHSGARALIAMTHSGYTAYRLSSHRPKANIFIFTNNRSLLRTLSLVWGVRGYFYDGFVSTDRTFEEVKRSLLEKNLIAEGDIVVNVASMPIAERGKTNTVKLSRA